MKERNHLRPSLSDNLICLWSEIESELGRLTISSEITPSISSPCAKINLKSIQEQSMGMKTIHTINEKTNYVNTLTWHLLSLARPSKLFRWFLNLNFCIKASPRGRDPLNAPCKVMRLCYVRKSKIRLCEP